MSREYGYDNIGDTWRDREERRKTSEKLIKAIEQNTPPLSKFQASPEHTQIRRHENYVRDKERLWEKPSVQAQSLEALFQMGVAQGRLLNDPENSTYTTKPIWTTRYDDIRNRIDAAAVIHATPESNNDGVETDIVFGFDLTLTTEDAKIEDKLFINTNDPHAHYPVGFSQIEYYESPNGQLGKQRYVPRFCIGISEESVNNYLDDTSVDRNGVPHVRSGADVVPSFKILYEMSLQSGLFEGPLYAKLDKGTITPEEEDALNQLAILDNIYTKELDRITKKLPLWLVGKCKAKDGKISTDEVARVLMHDEDYADPVFAKIVQITEKASAAFDETEDEDGVYDPEALERKRAEVIAKKFGHAAVNAANNTIKDKAS